MPQQETFLELQTPDSGVVTIMKTYDQQFAKQVFAEVDEEAKALLWKSLKMEETYDTTGFPGPEESEDRDAMLLDEMLDEGRDVWPDFSYFVVAKKLKGHTQYFYVSPDWTSAEEYVKVHFQLPPVPARRPSPTITPN